jgi:hypothetical protein
VCINHKSCILMSFVSAFLMFWTVGISVLTVGFLFSVM